MKDPRCLTALSERRACFLPEGGGGGQQGQLTANLAFCIDIQQLNSSVLRKPPCQPSQSLGGKATVSNPDHKCLMALLPNKSLLRLNFSG